MRLPLIVIAAVLALCACGPHYASGSAAPPESANPSIAPGPGFDIAVSEKTRTATIRVGQTLEAVLHANPGMTAWSDVRSSDPSVLAPIVDPAASAARGVTLAGFRAIAPGTVRITATAGPDCPAGQACPAYLVVLAIDVTVTVVG